MPIEVTLAKLSPTMESGQLVKWNVKVGDKVKEGDILADIQTDKAVMPMEAFDEGTVALLDVAEGEDIALGQRVMVLAKKGEDAKAIADSAGAGKAATKAEPQKKAEPNKEAVEKTASPAPQRAAAPATNGDGNGHEPAPVVATGRVKASPLAKKVAVAAGVDLARVRGSGPGGRIVRADVEKAKSSGGSAPVARPAAARKTERVPHTRMRKTIAQRMLASKQAAPEIHLTSEIRMDRVVSLREQVNAIYAAEKVKVSISDFITKAVAVALRRHPALNASYEDDAIVQHGDINIGIAVALEGGLIVPVIHNADQLDLKAIRQGSVAIAEAARANKLTSSQMMGGTFTISNLGMYGIKQFDAIINLPEVAILAVGATEQRPVVDDGKLGVGWLMSMTLTADHRAVDGATGAQFMHTLRTLLEEPALMLL